MHNRRKRRIKQWTEHCSDIYNLEISKNDAMLNVSFNNNNDQHLTKRNISSSEVNEEIQIGR